MIIIWMQPYLRDWINMYAHARAPVEKLDSFN